MTAAIAHDDPLPPGPYTVGLTHTPRGDDRPYTICSADGHAIAGHVESRIIADAICEALNHDRSRSRRARRTRDKTVV